MQIQIDPSVKFVEIDPNVPIINVIKFAVKNGCELQQVPGGGLRFVKIREKANA